MPEESADNQTKTDWLLKLCKQHVEKYVVKSEFTSIADQTGELDRCFKQHFTCRHDGCDTTFALHSRRVRYTNSSSLP